MNEEPKAVFEKRQADRDKLLNDTRRRVAQMLHQLVSPFDQSEENLRAQMLRNPVFQMTVEKFTHLLIQCECRPNEQEQFRELEKLFSVAGNKGWEILPDGARFCQPEHPLVPLDAEHQKMKSP
jgi:hypothetical protein